MPLPKAEQTPGLFRSNFWHLNISRSKQNFLLKQTGLTAVILFSSD